MMMFNYSSLLLPARVFGVLAQFAAKHWTHCCMWISHPLCGWNENADRNQMVFCWGLDDVKMSWQHWNSLWKRECMQMRLSHRVLRLQHNNVMLKCDCVTRFTQVSAATNEEDDEIVHLRLKLSSRIDWVTHKCDSHKALTIEIQSNFDWHSLNTRSKKELKKVSGRERDI